mgnify:CR=1 FL=1
MASKCSREQKTNVARRTRIVGAQPRFQLKFNARRPRASRNSEMRERLLVRGVG